MNQTEETKLLEQIEKWNDADEFSRCIEAIEAIPCLLYTSMWPTQRKQMTADSLPAMRVTAGLWMRSSFWQSGSTLPLPDECVAQIDVYKRQAPPSPFEHRISFCGCAFCERF